jgi:hypothetical protein
MRVLGPNSRSIPALGYSKNPCVDESRLWRVFSSGTNSTPHASFLNHELAILAPLEAIPVAALRALEMLVEELEEVAIVNDLIPTIDLLAFLSSPPLETCHCCASCSNPFSKS